MGRPLGTTGRCQLKTEDRYRVRTLYFDAKMSPSEIQRVTGFTSGQIRYAIRAESAVVKPRSGRPRVTKEKSKVAKKGKEAVEPSQSQEVPQGEPKDGGYV